MVVRRALERTVVVFSTAGVSSGNFGQASFFAADQLQPKGEALWWEDAKHFSLAEYPGQF